MAKRLKFRCIFDRRRDLGQVSSLLWKPVFYEVKTVGSAGLHIHLSPTVLTVATGQCFGIIMDVNLENGTRTHSCCADWVLCRLHHADY